MKHAWNSSGWDWIDPLKEVNANKAAIDSNQTTLSAVIAKNSGADWKELLTQRAAEKAFIKNLEETYGVNMEGDVSVSETENGEVDTDD